LSFLFESSPKTVNIRPLIDGFVSEGHHSGTYFGTMLNSMRTAKQVWFDDVLCLSWTGNSPYEPDHPIKARIEPPGLDEYYRLKKQYSPEPPTQPSVNIGGNVIGSVIGNQSSLEISQSSLTTATPSIKPSKSERRMSLWVKVGIIATIFGTLFVIWEFIIKRFFHQP
jgi:hypothetical protein